MVQEQYSDDRSIVSPYKKQEDDESELRPSILHDFIGQKTLKDNLRVFVQAAYQRKEAVDHTFINGPPGLGKTTLARIIAHEREVPFKATSAPALDKPKDLVGMLSTLEPYSIFFIDEIHRLRPIHEEMLYIAMEDFEIDWVIGQGPAARNVRIPLPPFTLVGATTKAGMVSAPLYSRFGITFHIDLYTLDELAHIIMRSAHILNIHIYDDAAHMLARCSRGTPRIANRVLRRMRDFAEICGNGEITTHIIIDGMQRLAIDKLGLEKQDRRILRNIIINYGGGPVGAETLAISVGESVDSLEDFYEPYLIQQGLLQRTARGRVATKQAYAHLGISSDSNEIEDNNQIHLKF